MRFIQSFTWIIAAVFMLVSFASCEKIKGKGEVITQNRSVGSFSSVSLSMSADVHYEASETYTLSISGQENVINEIVTTVEGNRLVIRLRNGIVLGKHEPVRVYVGAPSISGFEISGSGNIYADSKVDPATLSLTISGSGNINLSDLDVDKDSANISGSGNIGARTGTAARQDLVISGSGTIDLRNVVCPMVYTTTSGSGDTYIHADSILDVTISGSGNVWYNGTPAVYTHISGSGNVKKL